MKRAPFDGGAEIEIRQVSMPKISAKPDAGIARAGRPASRASGEEVAGRPARHSGMVRRTRPAIRDSGSGGACHRAALARTVAPE